MRIIYQYSKIEQIKKEKLDNLKVMKEH